jgi:two-component system, chemotaxis family, protein-glutamate methylesterase/glutaminase
MSPPEKDARTIRVLVADDSAFMRTALTRMIQFDPQLQVVATAQNGKEALEKIAEFDPDVITLDIEMPKLDGLGVLRQLMAENPKPAIIVSSLTQEGAEETLNAFDLGAFDCIPKTLSYASLDIMHIRDELIAKLKAGAAAKETFRRKKQALPKPVLAAPRRAWAHKGPIPSVVAIGTSTGGPKALQEVLPLLPADLPAGIVIVQHMPQGFTGPFARRLDGLSKLTVHEAVDGEAIKPGLALLAPATWHMTLFRRSATQYSVRLSKNPPKTLHTPSVDVMMLSAAEVCGASVMGVIMTGMGYDGSLGMRAIHEKGGRTLGQDEASCAVYGMPRACAEMGTLDRVVPLSHISEEIIHAVCPAAETIKPSV